MSIQRQLDLFKNWSKYGKDIWCPFKDIWTCSKFRTSIVRSYGVHSKTPGLVQSLEHVW